MIDVLAQCHSLALTIAPELRSAPLYVVRRPEGYLLPECCDAFATRATDYQIRQHLINAGEWHGPGNFIIFGELPDDTESLIGLTLHEVAHLLPHQPFVIGDHEPTTDQINHQSALHTRWATEPDPSNRPPWYPCHGLHFTRTCLHLRHRAAVGGLDVPLPAISFAGQHYGLSGAWKYRNALSDEPARLAGSTFTEILATDPPAEFTALFQSDTQHWHTFRSNQNAP